MCIFIYVRADNTVICQKNIFCLFVKVNSLKYFLGFQVKQLQEGTFISQTKYTQDILNKFGMKDAKPIKTPMGTNWLFYPI